ncbi:MAG: DNA repair protein RadA [Bacteroidia bacterium]|nr:DNA repair protein RadA [Bacteroidia bacterium]
MGKTKTTFTCQSCGTIHLKWQGQCTGCGEWSTLVEEIVSPTDRRPIGATALNAKSTPKPIADITFDREQRINMRDQEMNRVLGGGLVEGSVILLGGEPGIGKSTLLLQMALQMTPHRILYVSGEESEQQIKLRAERIPFANPNLLIAAETHLERIFEFYESVKPDLIIIDSIQTMFTDALESAPGSVSQVREGAAKVIRLAKETRTPVFLVGHITKDGTLAGPKVLEHMVDTVLTFEGDRHNSYRIVRTSKNRFGSTMEIGIYEMMASGLREVSNPSEIFLSGSLENFSGVCISATMEGLRPLLVETQALVSPMAYGTAQRSATGFDLRRLNMLLAVLEKRCGFKMGVKDVFINITGGLRVEDPAVDLALICAVISSLHDLPVPQSCVFAAEVGLSGEIRAVNRVEPRIAEAEKLGFQKIYVTQSQASALSKKYSGIQVRGVSKLEEVFREVFGGN